MRRIKTTLLLLVLLGGLIPVISNAQCLASFSTSVSGSTVTITNSSSSYNSLTWSYGDNTYGYSYANTHTKTYNTAGTYLICLTVSDSSQSCTHTYCDTVVIAGTPGGGCTADFSSSTSGLTAYFIDSSYATFGYSLYWDFGDGNTSTAYYPNHTYSSAGNYMVCLTVVDTVNNCSDSICKSVTVAGSSGSNCSANFSYSASGTTATFSNSSSNNVYNTWYFGDGSSSMATNPTYTYSSAGTYTVCLIIQDSLQNCTDSICKSVTVTSSSTGCSANFNYTNNNGTVTFTNTSNNNISNTWTFGDGSNSSLVNPVHTYTTNGNYLACLTIVDSSQNCFDSICKVITITGAAPCAASFTHTTTGLTVVTSNTSAGGSTFGTTYSWNMGNGVTMNGYNTAYSYPQAGTYVVCLTMTDTSSNCFSTFCDTVTVGGTTPCQASFNYNISGLSASFFNSSTGTTPGTSYFWNFGDGNYAYSANPSHGYAVSGSYVVCLTITDSLNNCSSTRCDTISVQGGGSGNCKASFTYSGSSLLYFFTNTSTPNNGAITWIWDMGDGTTLWNKNPQHHYQNPGTYVVCLTMYDSLNNCNNSFCDTLVVTSTNPCQASFNIIPDSLNPNNLSFVNTSTPQFGVTYQWVFSDGTVYGTRHVNRTFTTPGTYTVCLHIQDSLNQCSDSTCQTFTISAPVTCDAKFTPVPNGKNVIFMNQSIPNSGSVTYSWNFGDGTPGSSVKNPTHNYANYGTYVVCLTIVDSLTNCWDTHCDTLVLSAPVACAADFNIIDSNGTFVFINTSTSAQPLTYTYWTFGDGNHAYTYDAAHTYAAPGTYTVCLYVEDSTRSCMDSVCKSVTVNSLSAQNVNLEASSVSVYPNPFDNQINISWSQDIDQVSIRLYDLTGKAMLLETSLSAERGLTHTLDLTSQSLSSGVYYLEISTGQNKATYPIYKR
ncbi:PKD domain-containing protein [bacterium SCSIO 12741]|nr:PKD domain-containing protein [bacterium SCSIO 12741]